MIKKSRAFILSSLLLGGLILSTTVSCGEEKQEAPLKTYVIAKPTVTPAEGGKFSMDPAKVIGNVGSTIDFNIITNKGYTLSTIKINSQIIDNKLRSFKPIEGTNTIAIEFTKNGETKVTIDSAIANGKVTIANPKDSYKANDEVTLNVEPDSGYKVKEVKNNNTVITPVDGVYKFKVVAGENKITATFEETLVGAKTIYVDWNDKVSGFSASNIYMFDSASPETNNNGLPENQGDSKNGWPGKAMTGYKGSEIVYTSGAVSTDDYDTLIFNITKDNQDPNSTVDIALSEWTAEAPVYQITGTTEIDNPFGDGKLNKFTGAWVKLDHISDLPVEDVAAKDIVITQTDHGTISVKDNALTGKVNEKREITFTPETGYRVKAGTAKHNDTVLTLDAENKATIRLTKDANVITAEFEKIPDPVIYTITVKLSNIWKDDAGKPNNTLRIYKWSSINSKFEAAFPGNPVENFVKGSDTAVIKFDTSLYDKFILSLSWMDNGKPNTFRKSEDITPNFADYAETKAFTINLGDDNKVTYNK